MSVSRSGNLSSWVLCLLLALRCSAAGFRRSPYAMRTLSHRMCSGPSQPFGSSNESPRSRPDRSDFPSAILIDRPVTRSRFRSAHPMKADPLPLARVLVAPAVALLAIGPALAESNPDRVAYFGQTHSHTS